MQDPTTINPIKEMREAFKEAKDRFSPFAYALAFVALPLALSIGPALNATGASGA